MKAILSLACVMVVGVLAGCGENAVPENITYEHDVKAVLDAHCVRCHGAGGTLNADPDISPDWIASHNNKNVPQAIHLDTITGAMVYANGGFKGYFVAPLGPMPPPPAPPLTDYEQQILSQWKGN